MVHQLLELDESQLRELVNAQSTWRAFNAARREASQVKGSMTWKQVGGGTYLIRASASGAQKSLGPKDERTVQMFENFQARKKPAQMRLAALKKRLEEQRKLNRVYRVGRVPTIVVRALAALDAAGVADNFMVIGTHSVYAYETAAGVRVEPGALATMDLDLLFDARQRLAFATTLQKGGAGSLIGILRKADPTFKVMRNQLQTAVNDDGFEIDVIRRKATGDDPHPMLMSEDEDDFWAVQIADGDKIASGRRFEQLVIGVSGEMAMMRTLHPLDFIRLKQRLSKLKGRDPQKAPKDRLQAKVVQQLWDEYLHRLERPQS
ncbi:GSU2403 family nucleotidyltransferase fold protein [Caenimonas sp. SL110]|uniref:GSU2403 family nucleotidyltransferase fold protein n=1 Tax=Caenimonas sp. SL110 TaxID=1450524 RepID=UPI000652ADB0|nr:GSU2403 family nucleotidyltransferase fold protein [Caenimonas sp. SL110]